MKLTNGEIFNAKKPLEKLLDKELPVKTSYGLAKLAHKLNSQLEVIGQVVQGLRKTYGAPDPRNPRVFNVLPEIEGEGEDGKKTTEPNPSYEKFNEEINELMAQEVELVIEEVTLPDTLEIEPSVLMALEKFIKV